MPRRKLKGYLVQRYPQKHVPNFLRTQADWGNGKAIRRWYGNLIFFG